MSEDIPTIDRTLAWASEHLRAASAAPRLDAELLLAHVLGWSRAHMLAEGRAPLGDADLAAFRALVARRAALEPVAYLLGHKEFYGLDFVVDRSVLVPRPETELLVDAAIALTHRQTTDHRPPTTEPAAAGHSSFSVQRSSFVVADIGTGSGCIAVAVAAHLPGALVYATDLVPAALSVARRNVERHGLADRVRLLEGDLLDPLPEPIDLLLSNPPYTILAEIDEGVRRHEPRQALDGGPDGLAVYRQLLATAPARLRPGGAVALEIGAEQSAAVSDLARAHFPTAQIEVYQDLAGLDRVVVIET